jgi:hypothetical protein
VSDNLKHGEEMEIARRVYRFEPKGIAALIALPMEELQVRREKSAAAETAIFDKLCEDAGTWEAQASETLLIDMAIEYAKTRAVEHTMNEWRPGSHGGQEISNTVYKMWYCVNNDTEYNREIKKHVTIAWHLTWDVWTNGPSRDGFNNGHRIAGQFRKRFTDKAAMEKYLQGRIKAYSHLFTELSPPISKEFEQYFQVNGQLLPGYTVEGQEAKQTACAADQKKTLIAPSDKKPSAMERLAAAKEAVAQNDANPPSQSKAKEKAHNTEL